jgi:hypothetical protein
MDASPNLIRRLVLPRFESGDRRHRLVASLAALVAAGQTDQQDDLDQAVSVLYAR